MVNRSSEGKARGKPHPQNNENVILFGPTSRTAITTAKSHLSHTRCHYVISPLSVRGSHDQLRSPKHRAMGANAIGTILALFIFLVKCRFATTWDRIWCLTTSPLLYIGAVCWINVSSVSFTLIMSLIFLERSLFRARSVKRLRLG